MKSRKFLSVIAAVALSAAVVLTGCQSTPAATTAATTEATVAPTVAATTQATTAAATTAAATVEATSTPAATVSGSITAVGSTALQPLAQKAADLFSAKNADAKVQVQGGGSGTGLTQVSQAGCDIGNSDVFAEDKLDATVASTLVDHKVCVVGFAAVVNSKVTVTNLTQQQLIDIFTGKITNWKDVGGSDMKIVILNRPASSGTRATFKKYALNGQEEAAGLALTEDSSGTVAKTLADTDGSISYLAFPYLKSNPTIKALQYNGVDPTTENVESGKYPIWSYEHMYTKGEATGLAKAFIDYMMSDEFKPQITDLGYIPNSDMKVSR